MGIQGDVRRLPRLPVRLRSVLPAAEVLLTPLLKRRPVRDTSFRRSFLRFDERLKRRLRFVALFSLRGGEFGGTEVGELVGHGDDIGFAVVVCRRAEVGG